MTRYTPSRNYLPSGMIALCLAVFSGWCALRWMPAAIPAVLFLVSASLLVFLALRPPIEIREDHLAIGKRVIPWPDIRRLDRTGWVSPLIVHITLANDSRVLLVYPGDLDSANSLLRHLRRLSAHALIDGIPYRQFWGEALPAAPDRKQLPSPRYQLLREEDEAEVERLYQRLKTVGHLDPKKSPEEK
jgi:hypothetical protein